MGFEYDCRPPSGELGDALTARLLEAIDAAHGVASSHAEGVFWLPTDDPRWPVTVAVHPASVLVALPDRLHAGRPAIAALLAQLRDAGLTLHEQGDPERISWSELIVPPTRGVGSP